MKQEKNDSTSMFVLLAVALIGLFVLALYGKPTITGMITYGTKEDVAFEVQQFVQDFPLTRFAGQGANICLLIDVGFQEVYSYDITKDSTGIRVLPSPTWDCGGSAAEDFIIKYVSYEAFIEHRDEQNCNQFLYNGRGENFWYLPSKLWPQGGEPLCNDEFKQKYCSALYYCTDPETAPGSSVLSCCSKRNLNDAQLAMARAAAEQGIQDNARGKSTVLQHPFFQYLPTLSIFIFGALVLIFLVLGGIHMMQKKPKSKQLQAMDMLQSYIETTLQQDFSEEEIRQELSQQGWPEDMVDTAFLLIEKKERNKNQ